MVYLNEARPMISNTPYVTTFESFDFPIEECFAGGRKVLVLPPGLRNLFKTGTHVIRINSLEVARTIPNFGSQTSGRYSFLPHKDNFGDDEDPKRYLVLTKTTDEPRGASTLACLPQVAEMMLPVEEKFFHKERITLGRERAYNDKFQMSEEQYDRCFNDPYGYPAVTEELLPIGASPHKKKSTSLNVLNYLIRGPSVGPLMKELMRRFGSFCFEERWERGGVLILDNARLSHAVVVQGETKTYPSLDRNFCI